jgi:hypothetical protein
MDGKDKPANQEPTILLSCTSEEAAVLLAATTNYLMHAKRNTELQEVIPHIESLQRTLVELARGRMQSCQNSLN